MHEGAEATPGVEPTRVASEAFGIVGSLAASPTAAADLGEMAERIRTFDWTRNLLSNAVKFTASGGCVALEAATSAAGLASSAPDVVFLRVRDTGCGIPADKLESIFDSFVQVHRNLTRSIEGSGLGLSISRDLARGMGGDLTAESVEGAGATFTLTLRQGGPADTGPA